MLRRIASKPWICDLAIALLGVPLCTYMAYKASHGKAEYFPPSVYDMLLKRESRIAFPAIFPIEKIPQEYSNTVKKIKEIMCEQNFTKDKHVKLQRLLQKLEVINQAVINNNIGEKVLGSINEYLPEQKKIASLGHKPYEFLISTLGEGIARIILETELKLPGKNAQAAMQIQEFKNSPSPYASALALAFELNQKNEEKYDGIVTPLYEPPTNYERDIVFIHGQQSHGFNNWRCFKPCETCFLHGRPYQFTKPWPPLYLNDGKTRLLTVSYPSAQSKIGSVGAYIPNYSISEISDLVTASLARSGVGQRPVIFVTHSFGAVVIKNILARGIAGDSRVQGIIKNIKGVCFIAGPHNPASFLLNCLQPLRNKLALVLRFDGLGESAISVEEAEEYILTSIFHSKTTAFVYIKNPVKFSLLQKAFDSLNIPAICMTEKKESLFGVFNVFANIYGNNEDKMENYPEYPFLSRNHNQICKVGGSKDPVLLQIKKFVDENFGN